jgi:hypothetical protein
MRLCHLLSDGPHTPLSTRRIRVDNSTKALHLHGCSACRAVRRPKAAPQAPKVLQRGLGPPHVAFTSFLHRHVQIRRAPQKEVMPLGHSIERGGDGTKPSPLGPIRGPSRTSVAMSTFRMPLHTHTQAAPLHRPAQPHPNSTHIQAAGREEP